MFLAAGEAVASNAPVPKAATLADADEGHLMIDLGEDEYTQGRPHPMIDPSVRDERLIQSLEDPTVGVVLVDVVIGHGTHHDPAGHLAGVLAARRPADGPVVVASVTGTDDDPQGLTAQSARLEAAGVRCEGLPRCERPELHSVFSHGVPPIEFDRSEKLVPGDQSPLHQEREQLSGVAVEEYFLPIPRAPGRGNRRGFRDTGHA